MKIEVGEIYTHVKGDCEVLKKKVNNCGNEVYACCLISEPTLLFWAGKEDLSERSYLLPLQKEMLAETDKQITIVAAGVGSGFTRGMFERILQKGEHCNIVSDSIRKLDWLVREFTDFCDSKSAKYELHRHQMIVSLREQVTVSSCTVSFSTRVETRMTNYFDTSYEKALHNYLDYRGVQTGELVFCTLPSDLIRNYSTTTENGYYEVKNDPDKPLHPLMTLLLNRSGKIPKATENCLKKFIGKYSNLITGYSCKDNVFLDKAFKKEVEGLDPLDKFKCKGMWVKL